MKKTSVKLDAKKLIPICFAALAVIIGIFAIVYKSTSQSAVLPRGDTKGTLIFIDAGHGGNDDGSESPKGKRVEKDDNLKMALAVQDKLNEAGLRTEMSRSTDERVELNDRWKAANKAKADLFVSIHRNSADSGKGVEIWVQSTKPKKDTLLGENILKQLDGAGISNNRGVRFGYMGNSSSDYAVNKGSKMPSCLIELGFITNEEDNELFDKNFDAYAQAIAQGIIQTANKLKLQGSEPV